MELEELLEDEVTPCLSALLDLHSHFPAAPNPVEQPQHGGQQEDLANKSQRAKLCDPKGVRLDFAAWLGVSYGQICRTQSPFH